MVSGVCKAEMRTTFEAEDIQAIAEAVIEKLKPLLCKNEPDDDQIMTIEEVAKFLQVSKAQVYQWVNNSQHGLGDFPFLKAGKLLRFSKKAILNWLEKR